MSRIRDNHHRTRMRVSRIRDSRPVTVKELKCALAKA